MKSVLYKKRENKMVSGVCSGIADKFGWDLPLTRVLTALLIYFYGFGLSCGCFFQNHQAATKPIRVSPTKISSIKSSLSF